jgi:hypothetical protein
MLDYRQHCHRIKISVLKGQGWVLVQIKRMPIDIGYNRWLFQLIDGKFLGKVGMGQKIRIGFLEQAYSPWQPLSVPAMAREHHDHGWFEPVDPTCDFILHAMNL